MAEDGNRSSSNTGRHNGGALPAESIRRALALPERYRGRVLRDRLEFHWIDDDHGWYRVNSGKDAYEWYFVDGLQGSKKILFDWKVLEEKLAKALGESSSISSAPLQIGTVGPDGDSIEFRFANRNWKYDSSTGTLQESDQTSASSLQTRRRIGRSRRAGSETELILENHRAAAVDLFWIDTQGQRQAYGSIEAGKTRSQHTYAGHVWLVTDKQGLPLAAFEAREGSGTAIIDEQSDLHKSLQESSLSEDRANDRPLFANRQEGLSPDGQYRAELRDRNLVLVEVATQKEHSLSTSGNLQKGFRGPILWSSDSKKLLVLEEEKGEGREIQLIDSTPDDQLQPKVRKVAYDKPGDRIDVSIPALFDIDTKQRTPIANELFANPWDISELRWSTQPGHFTFLYNQRGHQIVRLISVDSQTGLAHVVLEEKSPTFIDYAHKMFHRYLDASHEMLWMSERDGWCHLYLIDLDSGEVKNQVTRGQWIVRNVEHVDAEKRQIWFSAGGIDPNQDPYHAHLCRVDFDGSNLVQLTRGNGNHRWEFSPNRKYILDAYSRVDMAPVTELRRADDGTLVSTLETADAKGLLEAGWRWPEPFVAKGRDDVTDIYGIIVRPSGFDPDRKYPVIESIYAGPQGAFVPKDFGLLQEFQQLAELGFIVVQIDGMGTSERSKAFHDVCFKNIADAGFPDRKRWLQAAASKYPQMDLSRVGIYGGSAGGQNALGALLFHGDFYHVAVADCGCHDNRMDKIWWNELWMGWPIDKHYEEQSNAVNAHRLKGELMLVVGELDDNVDPASTLQVVDALIRADKDFELLYMTGMGHGAGGSPYGRRKKWEFFLKHLQP